MPEIAIADTCFLIDWARYRRRDILFELFSTVFVPEQVLGEIVSEETVKWVADSLAERKLSLYVAPSIIVNEALKLVDAMASLTWTRRVELPEAVCLSVGRKHGYTVLTENRGALQAVEVLPEYLNVKVMRAIDVLAEAVSTSKIAVSSIEEAETILVEYEKDTKHRFPRKDVERILEEVVPHGEYKEEVGET